MDSTCKEEKMSRHYLKSSSCFHKFIWDSSSSTVGTEMLRIPDKFVKKFGDDLSSVARLKIPNGIVWLVGLQKSGNKLLFHDGWHLFVKYYSITAGHFLIFKYEGKSNFNVYIFNLTAAEINYQLKTPITVEEPSQHRQCPITHEKEMEDDNSVEITGSPHPFLPHIRLETISERSNSQSSFSGKKKEENQHLIACSNFSKDAEGLTAENPLVQKMGGTFDGTDQEIHCHTMGSKNDGMQFLDGDNQIRVSTDGCELPVSHEEAGKMLQTYSFGESSNPPAMKNLGATTSVKSCSGVKKRDQNSASLKIQEFKCVFMRRTKRAKMDNLNETSQGNLKNKMGPGQLNESNAKPEPNEDEQLAQNGKEGDSFGMKIISRNFSVEKPDMTQVREKAINAAIMHTSENPSFMAILRSHKDILRTSLYVPADFAKTLPMKVSQFIKLRNSDGREWCVQCLLYNKSWYISKGWRVFVLENNLVEGDVCVFELIHDAEVVLKVTIFRPNEMMDNELGPPW